MRRLSITSFILLMTSVIMVGAYWIREKVVKDQTGPVFTIEDEVLEVGVEEDESALLRGITASDASDGDVTSSIIVESISPFTRTGNRVVKYAAFDSDNHVTHARREITYTDYTGTRFELSNSLTFPLNAKNLLKGVRAKDCLDGDITGSIKMMTDEDIDVSHIGEYSARLKVTNSAGGSSYLPVTIEIYDSSAHYKKPQLTLSDYIVYVDRGSYFDEEDYIRSVTIGNEEYTFVNTDGTYGAKNVAADAQENTVNYDYVNIESDVNTDVSGFYEVNYSFTDTEGSAGTGTERLYVVVTEGGAN